jgi:hypothetical protein
MLTMKKVIAYQFIVLGCLIIFWWQRSIGSLPDWFADYEISVDCTLIALLGGVLYCLRAVYLNRCVQNRWSPDWEAWYYLRPITSAISGLIAYTFLRAGLIVLEAIPQDESSYYGFMAFAFIAGLNVDNFMVKIEEIGKATFGIEISRTSKGSKNTE